MSMHSLSARLLLLTIAFAMLAEVLIFVPSVARFRESYFLERLRNANLAILALDATPDGVVSDALKRELLDTVGVEAISARRGDMRLTLIAEQTAPVSASFDLRGADALTLISDAFDVYTRSEDRTVQVIGLVGTAMGTEPKPGEGTEVQIVLNEKPLAEAMVDFGWRIFWLSIVIAVVTASLVFLALQWLLVRPMGRITENMVAFSDNPEDAARIMRPSNRRDEVGTAERELADMQESLRAALQQKEHLAALGTAVAKINHDLKGILSRAILVFDHLEESQDPEVRKIAPTLISSIDRAIAMCGQTLNYVGAEQPTISWSTFSLEELAKEIKQQTPDTVTFTVQVPSGKTIEADRDQIYRVFSNLVNNAIEAGADALSIQGVCARDGEWVLEVKDNGPGLPPRAKENIFKPFKGSTKAGGTGLGLATAREIMRGHGGDLSLKETSGAGTTFTLHVPLRPVV